MNVGYCFKTIGTEKEHRDERNEKVFRTETYLAKWKGYVHFCFNIVVSYNGKYSYWDIRSS